ncbi:13446_t:CDS:2 [Rhizophagus irregularis]|nr:13446_t:CDS:2 [Rhizophagus irregularis]
MDLSETSALTYEETVERPVYGYLLHNDEQRLEILEKCPNISAKELSITITNSWKSFSEEKKNEYAERAKELNWKCLSEYEKNAHLEHIKELANKLKGTRRENSEINDRQHKKSRHLSYYSESDYDEQDSDEEVSEIDDRNICTQKSYKYDLYTNSPSTASNNLPKKLSSELAHHIIDNTPKMLQYYPKTDPESIKKGLFNDWNNMSPEQREKIVEQDHESYIQSNENSVSNTEYNNSSSDYDFLLNTDDSEVDESNQCYLQGLMHTYNNHKKSQYIESTHTPSYFHSEPYKQPPKKDEKSIENEELTLISSNDTPQRQSEVITQQFQQEIYGLKVPVPCITACEHYRKAVKFDGKNKHGSQTRQTELTKSINDRWKQMIFSERKIWEDIAKKDRERYEKEREEYLTSQYECFLRSQEGIPLNEWL